MTGVRSKRGCGPAINQIHTFRLSHTMLPPKRVRISPNEGNILLVLSAFTSGQCASISGGKEFNQVWFYQGLPSTLKFSVSANRWTTNQIGLQWIKHFEKPTRSKTTDSKRLLILDDHDSLTTPEFRTFCEDNNIILLWMSPHSSHLFKPLNVGCHSPLKTAFSNQNQNLIRNRIFHITKVDFLSSFYTAFCCSCGETSQSAHCRCCCCLSYLSK
jgi:hypothetical protein